MEIARLRTWAVMAILIVLTAGKDLLINMLAGVLSQQSQLIIAIGISVAALSVAYLALRRRVIGFRMKTPIPLPVDSATSATYAHSGLILPVSLYFPQDGNEMQNKKQEDWLEAAQKGDYENLDFLHSNLSNAIQSIKAHQACLKHVWLIATAPKDIHTPGSILYLDALCRYLKEKEHFQGVLHYGNQYLVPISSDIAITQMTANLVNKIYQEAADKSIGMKEEDIVTDITGSIRSVQLGALLACLDRRRKVQYVGSEYGANGKPVPGKQTPILYDFEPILAD